MRPKDQCSRRDFIASAAVLLAANRLGVAEAAEDEADKLAVNGGQNAVGRSMPKPVRKVAKHHAA